MTTAEFQDQEVLNQQTQDETGSLAESARRNIAYERLARQVAASEAAARLVLAALARAGQGADEAEPESSP